MATMIQQNIAIFDDSFQPTGIEFEGFVPHVKMKKLRHELTLTVDGPDDVKVKVEDCIKQAGVAAALTAVAAAFSGAGIGATSAAWSIFQSAFIGCVGSSVQAKIDDRSHWIEWRT